MSFLLAALVFFQAGVRNDLAELRQLLGTNYRGVLQFLDTKNQILLRNTERLAPAQAAQMRARMQAPDRLPAGQPVLYTRIDNVGQGLATFLFEDDFITEQVNFVFCPAQGGDQPPSERLMAIQILLDDSPATAPAAVLFRTVYQLPAPLALGAEYQPVLMYPVRPNVPLTIWNLGTVEVLYQPVPGQRLVTGQLWLTGKTVVTECAAIPKLPAPGP